MYSQDPHLGSSAHRAVRGTAFVPLPHVHCDVKDLSHGGTVHTESCLVAGAWMAKLALSPAQISFLLGTSLVSSVGLLGAASIDYLQQIKHKLGSVILLGALGYHQCTQH